MNAPETTPADRNTAAARLNDATGLVAAELQRSLVVLHNGRHGAGAGIIWSQAPGQSLVLTNHHVVAHGHNLRAVACDGVERPARVVAQDEEIDLALLEVEWPAAAQDGASARESGDRQPQAATLGDSRNLRVGELVLAIGHPWGQRGAVTAGLVSRLGKAHTQGARKEIEIIISDVRLAPGNSGGPLVNARGQVVGINTMIVGGDQGLAVPSHLASAFISDAVGKQSGAEEKRQQ